MSNALVVSGAHTESGHPVAVFGPQTGYFAPQLLTLQELQGPGISSKGASFAGLSFYTLLGRGQDYAWSATTAGQDIIDTYAVELCEPNGGTPTKNSAYYRFRGECLPFDVVERKNAWTPTLADGTAAGSYTLRSYRTRYGPVTHRATVGGKPVAYTTVRSTFLHEADSIIGFQKFNDPSAITSARSSGWSTTCWSSPAPRTRPTTRSSATAPPRGRAVTKRRWPRRPTRTPARSSPT